MLTPEQIISENLIEVGKILANYTPPLYINSYKPELVSSSLLVKWRNNHFLVTAGHTIKKFGSTKLGFIYNRTFQTLGGHHFTTSSDKIENDQIDIGAFHLDEETVSKISVPYSFYDLSKFDQDHEDSSKDDYMVVGHPISRTKIRPDINKILLRPFLFKTGLVTDEKIFNKTNTRSKVNFMLHYRKQKIINLPSKQVSQGPQPNGLSGCGVWKISNPITHDINLIGYFPTGIIIEYYNEHNILIGTRMRIVMECLRQAFDPSIPSTKLLTVNTRASTS